MQQISAELVERAKKDDDSGTDLLTLMVRTNTAPDLKPSQRLSDEELREMVPVFLFAGHETTATALSWSMLSLMNSDTGVQIQQRLREELLADDVWRSDPLYILDNLPYLASVWLTRTLPYGRNHHGPPTKLAYGWQKYWSIRPSWHPS